MDMDEDSTPDDAGIARTIDALGAQMDDPDVESRRDATRKLYDLCYAVGSRARAAVPLFIGRLADADEQVGESAVWGLRYCWPDSVEPLIDSLASYDENVRWRACHALGHLEDEAVAACDALRRVLADPVRKVRTRAALALGLVRDTSERTIAALSSMMRSDNAEERAAALQALGNLGKALVDPGPLLALRPAIMEALEHDDRDVRRCACHALAALRLEPAIYAHVLMKRLHDERDEDIRYRLADELKALIPDADLVQFLPAMCDVVRSRDRAAPVMCEVLALIGPAAHATVPVLLDALNDENDRLVIAAAEALWAITGQADELLPALERVFDDNGESVCDAVYVIGPAAAPLLGKLVEALACDDYWDLQWAAADALSAIASSDPNVIRALGNALTHESPIVKSAATRALARVGPPALPMLLDMLNETGTRAEWAAHAIGSMGPQAASAAAALRQHMDSADGELAGWCAIALAKTDGDPVVVPALIALLANERADVRHQAAVALGAIGPPAASALKALRAALDDEDADVREAAQHAVTALTSARH